MNAMIMRINNCKLSNKELQGQTRRETGTENHGSPACWRSPGCRLLMTDLERYSYIYTFSALQQPH